MAINLNQYNPDYCVHPGEYLEEILESREIKKKDFAERTGISPKAVSQIINQKTLYSSDITIKFEKVLGISAEVWMNMSSNFQLFLARKREKELILRRTQWLKKFPIKELQKVNVLPKVDDVYQLTEKILDFFNISSPKTWDKYFDNKSVAYRKSPAFKGSKHSIATWLRLGEIKAQSINTQPFDKDVFKNNLTKIRNLTQEKVNVFEKEMKNLCKKSGVALVFVEEIKGTSISGATEWLTANKAMILMSLRYKSNDHFWFTFFHEAAHIILHGKKDIYIDSPEGFSSQKENEANNFACNILVNQLDYRNSFSNRISRHDVIRFANQQK